MIAPQSPSLQVFVPIEPVSRADMPSQHLRPIATVEAHHVILMNGSPYRHGRDKNFRRFNRLSKLTERLINGSDEIRNLIRSQPMLPYVALDDHRC
jgi:hypothetical protein